MPIVKKPLEEMLKEIGRHSWINFELRADKARIASCLALFSSFWKNQQYHFADQKAQYQFHQLIMEMFTNAVTHGCKDAPEISVKVGAYSGEKGIVVEVQDSGNGYRIEDVMERAKGRIMELYENPGEKGGLGILYLLLATEVNVSLQNNGSWVIMQYLKPETI